jgi:hypothetical protein
LVKKKKDVGGRKGQIGKKKNCKREETRFVPDATFNIKKEGKM